MTVKEAFESLDYGPAPESAALAKEWLAARGPALKAYINGEWVSAPQTFASTNPANGEELIQVAQCDGALVDQAVKAARAALPAWQALSPTERAKYLYAIARHVQKHSRLLAVLETMDNGKPIRETRDLDIPLVSRHFYHHAGWAALLDSEFPAYEPVGVCAQIIPWNFPLLMLSWKIAPALAAGNTVVLKPAEFTPITAIAFAEICEAVGLPKGVVNIVTGDGETGKHLAGHPDIDKLAFTGSTEVGRILRRQTAGTETKLSLELGGKSPFIVFEDADLDGAVEGLVDAIWMNQGQVCCAGSRLLVQESVAEKFYAKVKTRMASLRIGDPLDKAVDVGAVVDQVQLERITSLVEQGVKEGAQLYQCPCPLPAKGFYYPPTLLTGVGPADTVAQVEIFGPVLVSMTFRTPAEAIALANNTAYGLAATIWTENLNVAHDISAGVHAGTVWINCSNQFDGACGFGGYKESGYGREGGHEGMFEYLKPVLAKGSFSAKARAEEPKLDRTHKLYIGGKQARPDGGYSFEAQGQEFSRGNRKDVRNAVEAALSAYPGWFESTGHLRAQILYYLAENMAASAAFVDEKEHETAIQRVIHYAAWADKYDGRVHGAPFKGFVSTRNEAMGVAGLIAPEQPSLLGLVSTVLPLIAMGNAVVLLASESSPLAACEWVRVLEASDIPAGVINVLTGTFEEVGVPLSEHEAVQTLWHFGDPKHGKKVHEASLGNLKQTWVLDGAKLDWFAAPHPEFLRRATQVKNIWVPYGA